MNPLLHTQLQCESPLCETKAKLDFTMRSTGDGKLCALPSRATKGLWSGCWVRALTYGEKTRGTIFICWTVRSLRQEARLFYPQMCQTHNRCSINISCGMSQGKGTAAGSEQEQGSQWLCRDAPQVGGQPCTPQHPRDVTIHGSHPSICGNRPQETGLVGSNVVEAPLVPWSRRQKCLHFYFLALVGTNSESGPHDSNWADGRQAQLITGVCWSLICMWSTQGSFCLMYLWGWK